MSLYDLLFSENLSKQDIQKIKQVAVDLLAKVKAQIAKLDHWTDKQETKAVVDNLIRDTLWAQLPSCYDELSISQYRQRIYEYVYTRYPDVSVCDQDAAESLKEGLCPFPASALPVFETAQLDIRPLGG